MRIAIPIYPGFTATDALGPYEILSRLPGAEVRFVSSTPGLVVTDTGFLQLDAASLAAMPEPDLVVVPGAPIARVPMQDMALIDWLRAADRHTQWTASVCTGAFLLGVAGLLQGKRVTTHWLGAESLAPFGARFVAERVVFDGKLITCAGVTAGYDMALTLAARIAGDDVAMAIQLGIEYDPQPPFDAGSPAKAPPHIVARLRGVAATGAL
jgi:putative intracellular protease/amidase